VIRVPGWQRGQAISATKGSEGIKSLGERGQIHFYDAMLIWRLSELPIIHFR
jgi:hypothetical protein